MRNSKRKREFVCLLFLLPGLCGLLLFYGLPYVRILFYSVWNNPVKKEFVGAENYIGIFRNPAFRQAMANTVFFCLGGSALIVPLSLGLALLLERGGKRISFLRACLLSPMVVPAACTVMVWRVLFDRDGLANVWLGTTLSWLGGAWGKAAVLFLFLWKYSGYNMVVFLGALGTVPREQVEAAKLEGAGAFAVFRTVKLPCLSPAFFFVMLISMMNSFKLFREIYLLTGDYPTGDLYLLSHFFNNMLRTMEYQKMSAGAILFTGIVAAVLSGLYFLERHAGKDVEL